MKCEGNQHHEAMAQPGQSTKFLPNIPGAEVMRALPSPCYTAATRMTRRPHADSASSIHNFTPQELRKLRSLKDPYGIQKFLDDMPYHLEDTAWSPRKVLAERSSHCLEGAIFAAAARLRGGARHRPRHRRLSTGRILGCDREIELQRMPLARAGLPLAARAGHELLQHLLQPAARAHPAALFRSGKFEALRRAALDDHRQARLVHRLPPVRYQALPAAD